MKGFRDLYVLVFLHVETRRVWISPSTLHPDETWVKQQAVAFLEHAKQIELPPKLLMHDRDTKFTKAFDAIFDVAGAEGKQTAFRSPNTNAYVERFIQALQQEVLDHFIVFGEQHMDHLVSETVEHYHEERPHQSLGNEPPVNRQTTETPGNDTDETMLRIVSRERLGGRLKHYALRAA